MLLTSNMFKSAQCFYFKVNNYWVVIIFIKWHICVAKYKITFLFQFTSNYSSETAKGTYLYIYVWGIAFNNCYFTCMIYMFVSRKSVSKDIFCRFYQSGSHMTVYPMLISPRVIHQPFNKRMYWISHLGLQKLILH